MPSIVKILRVAADPTRLRILLLLQGEELSVAELQEILSMGQSTISTHLSQLKQAGLVEDRRTGKNNLYRLAPDPDPKTARPTAGTRDSSEKNPEQSGPSGPEGSLDSLLHELLDRAQREIPEAAADQAARRRVLRKRQDKMRAFFDSVAGRLNRNYVPGKSWKSLAEALLRLLPPVTIADLGAGEGSFALLLSQRAVRVIAVDSSANMIEVGREEARRNNVTNVDFRLGDMEELPIASAEADLVFFSQSLHHALHPARALEEAARILVPGGRVVILDLARHRFEEARDLYADEWLGFPEAELEAMLQKAGFIDLEATIVDKESEPPHFQTLLAVATKPH
jgi:ubiquinone/menaquinone biosynthesis C-methylase UbiE/DNA-binding transcriptional ArsR family regulator